MKKSKTPIKSEDFDAAFDRGEDLTPHLRLGSTKVQKSAIQRINLDMPKNLLERADKEADRIGVTRTSLFKLWIAERLDNLKTT